jgi:hypothetical protein
MCLLWTVLMGIAMFPPAVAFLKRPACVIVAILVVLAWGFYPLFESQHINPSEQYDCRFLDLLVPLALVPVALVLCVRPQWLAAKTTVFVWFSAAILVAQSLWQLSATYQWDKHVGNWKSMLAANSGPIFLTSGDLFNTPDINWANPCESLVLGPNKVQTIIMPSSAISWQPFDPLNPQSLPNLRRYGVDYSEYIGSLKRQKVVHD